MIDVFEEYTQLRTGHNWDSPSGEVLAMLVLAKVLQEVGQAITTELNQLPAELKYTYLQVQAGNVKF